MKKKNYIIPSSKTDVFLLSMDICQWSSPFPPGAGPDNKDDWE